MSLLWLYACIWAVSAHLKSFDEQFVISFVNKTQELDVSDECKESLSRVWPYLNAHDTLDTQRNYYHQSFGAGPAWLFLSRDQDRWVFRGYECVLSAGETMYSKSEHPMHFCYGMREEEEKTTSAYSVCIPSPCEEYHAQLLDMWKKQLNTDPDDKPLDFTSCIASRHQKQWWEQAVPVGDFVFNAGISLFVALATVFHLQRGEDGKSFGQKILVCFSLKKNLKKATTYPKDPQSTITALCGLRFLAMAWTLVGHSFIFVQAYLGNVEKFKNDMVDNFGNQWITNFTLSVDVFLTIGGCVLAYTHFRKWMKNTTEPEPTWTSWGYWLRFYRHRIVRLWPAYIYTILSITLRLSVTHWHPMWPPTDPAVQCPKHFWENIFFVNSLTNNRCMPWTWYIGTEFVYYLISPIFLISLRQSPIFGLSISLGVIAISSALNLQSIVSNNFPPTQFLWKQPEMFNPDFIQHHIELYIKPQYRIGPYVVGILLGYFLANYQRPTIRGNKPQQKKAVQQQPRSTRHVIVGWTLSISALFISLYGLYPSLQAWDWPIYHLAYGSLHRLVFSLGLAWVIYACHTGIGGFINTFLSAKPMVPLANLSYSAYLFHMIPVVFTYLLVPFPIMYNTMWYILAHCIVQLVISYILAFICSMSVEYPSMNIERLILHEAPKNCGLKPVPTAESEIQLRPSPPPSKK